MNKMDSKMLKNLKKRFPEKEYPSMLGAPWSEEEENQLLKELKELDIEEIAEIHNRTKGGINSRRKVIANRMYSENISIEEIMEKTKLNKKEIDKYVIKSEDIKNITKTNTSKNKINRMKSEIEELNEIIRMKNEINELKMLIKKMN